MSEEVIQPSDLSVISRVTAEKPRRLGKGLGALLGETRREEPLVRRDDGSGDTAEPSASALRMLALAAIKPLPGNPRKYFDEAALDELAASIAARGVIQPIIVRPHPQGDGFQLVAGERRWRAAQKARLHEIPALVRTLTDREVMALALIENLQREDLNPVEEARAYHRLSEDEGMIQVDIAKMVEKSRSHVANTLRLLQLPDRVLNYLREGKLSAGHARALINTPDAADLADRAYMDGLNVRQTEALARRAVAGTVPSTPGKGRPASGPATADVAALEQDLSEALGLKVQLTDRGGRGELVLGWRSLEQLDDLCRRLMAG